MVSEFQARAESILNRFRLSARKPVVIEFAGTPKAGKTTTISHIQTFLRRCGFSVKVVVERASVCPIRDKKHFNFNVWTASTTLAQILEHTQEPPREEDPQVLILDRGLFDSICWLTMMDRLSRIQTADRKQIENFLLIDDWRKRVTGVIVMTASPEEALKRERGYLPVEAEGSIMNAEVLAQNISVTEECIARLRGKLRIHKVDTSSSEIRNKPERTAEVVVDLVLDLIEAQLAEKILHLPRDLVRNYFEGESFLTGAKAEGLQEAFRVQGKFDPRDEVEKNSGRVQALPAVVIRNKSGDILRLRRKERDETSTLHKKIVVWAGGHVREEDATNGDPIILAAQRELQEELRLSVEKEELSYLGAVFVEVGDRLSKHLCLVYEWRADTDDVAITLSTAEFYERRGTSLSGKFIPLEQVRNEISSGDMDEPWSTRIIDHLLSGIPAKRELF